MSQDDNKPDIATLAELWGWEDVHRVTNIYGDLSAPNTKSFGDLIKPLKVKRGEKSSATKQQKGGVAKGLNAMGRLTEMRLMYLYLTLDMGMDQKLARWDLAKVYELSKSRIRDLVAVPKSKKPKN